MLSVPELDDLEYKKLFEQARGRIPALTDQWTDLNHHDPGITMLQTFAWLTDMLGYYEGATGEIHRLKYLKLLGIQPGRQPAKCRMAFTSGRERFALRRGQRFAAGDVVFELEQSCSDPANRLSRLYNEVDGFRRDLTAFAGNDDDSATLFTTRQGKSASVWFGFEKKLTGVVQLFVQVPDTGRSPFDESFSLAKLEWSVFGPDGWQTVQMMQDESCGFLRSGVISLALPVDSEPFAENDIASAHYLRCTLLENEYDAAPQVSRVYTGCLEAVQRHTYAEALVLNWQGETVLTLDRYVRDTDFVTVMVGRERFAQWYIPGGEDRCQVKFTGEPGVCEIHFLPDDLPSVGDNVLVLVAEAETAQMLWLDQTDGCSGQRMLFEGENLCALELALVRDEADGSRTCTLWHQVEDLAFAGCDDRVFAFDHQNGEIIFGDSIHGAQPDIGDQVLVATVQTSRFEAGNVLADRVTAPMDDPGDETLRAVNPEPARGGRNWKPSAELEAEVERVMKTPHRAVTEADYREIVCATPGLMIDSVAVIPMQEYAAAYQRENQQNTVVVAVKPASALPRPVLSDTYRRRIEQNLEKYRLLTTRVLVVPAQYVGVSVYGRIALMRDTLETRRRVTDAIAQFVDRADAGQFGGRVDYGALFAVLEMLDCVKNVQQLSLEYIGAAGKSGQGDILLAPDSLSYLRETGIEFF